MWSGNVPAVSEPTSPSVEEVLHAAVGNLGGEDRPGQVEMARAVREAMSRREHLLVQAGTGTGKSLGYLGPGGPARRPGGGRDGHPGAAAPAGRAGHPGSARGCLRRARRAAVVRRAQGAQQLRLPAPDPRRGARRPGHAGRHARGAARWRGAPAARVGRGGVEGRRDRRPRQRPVAHRAGLAAGLGQPPRVPRCHQVPVRRGVLRRARPRAGDEVEADRHQPLVARHRRDRGRADDPRVRRRRGRRGPRARRRG